MNKHKCYLSYVLHCQHYVKKTLCKKKKEKKETFSAFSEWLQSAHGLEGRRSKKRWSKTFLREIHTFPNARGQS